MNIKENKHGTLPVVTASTRDRSVTVLKGQGSRQMKQKFQFDQVYTSFSTQEEVFEDTLKPVIRCVFMNEFQCSFAHHFPVLAMYRTQICFTRFLLISHDSDVLNGFESTVFAYGQTGTGKVSYQEIAEGMEPLSSRLTLLLPPSYYTTLQHCNQFLDFYYGG
jgi:hypothetical protein